MKLNRRNFIEASAVSVAASLVAPASILKSQRRAGPGSLRANDANVKALLSRMTLEEKVGQMIQANSASLKDPGDVEKLFLGSILSGGSSDPKTGNSLIDWTDHYDSLQSRTQSTRLRIPILYGIDAVHGHSNVLNAVIFPHNIGLGCSRNPGLVERAARITAIETRATGINWTFAPCVTVPRDERWGRSYEGFGETPELARMMGEAAVRGYQGNDLSDPASVLACAKHWIGDGGTKYGTGRKLRADLQILDRGDVVLSESDLRKIHLAGYVSAIKAGVGTIMPSYSSWNGVKCSGSKRLLTEILKEELRFDGFLISDYDAIDEMPGDYKTQIETSTNAGMDMFMVSAKYRELYALLLELVRENRVAMSRIDDAVTRILRVKFAMGLMDAGRSHLADRKLHTTFGSAAHRQVARECVRASLVLLKNEKRVVPVSKNLNRIHVAGKSADDIGNQCGGWTISWQGKSGDQTSGGTTILKAIKETVSPQTMITYSADGANAAGADLGIVVIGETPYAEWMGDRQTLELSEEDVAVVDKMKQAGMPLLIVLISGRPLIIEKVIDKADAFVAAWLPGTEGRGVTDVLFGNFKPIGKLSFSWPRSMNQIPINAGDKNYDPLFAYGFGLWVTKSKLHQTLSLQLP
ncbi:MAG TPA: glycoside hydrolase family 3 N-terminal domain-containing protein [Pyrinomonadaceae bacterium]|nr:glycoside hydrolase family 3 N-terminal domain-containing protein [Pyrinomonadaceae bacterium]